MGCSGARWSQTTLHQEFERTFIKLYGDEDTAARQRGNIERAFPEALVIEDPKLMASLTLPDPDDRHVLAAAIQTKAALIVTQNLKDYPAESLAPHEIEAIPTDDFLADCIDLVYRSGRNRGRRRLSAHARAVQEPTDRR